MSESEEDWDAEHNDWEAEEFGDEDDEHSCWFIQRPPWKCLGAHRARGTRPGSESATRAGRLRVRANQRPWL